MNAPADQKLVFIEKTAHFWGGGEVVAHQGEYRRLDQIEPRQGKMRAGRERVVDAFELAKQLVDARHGKVPGGLSQRGDVSAGEGGLLHRDEVAVQEQVASAVDQQPGAID